MSKLSKEIAAYEQVKDVLEMDHFGEWVVFHDEKLVDTFTSFEEAAKDATRKFGRGPYLIRQIGEAPLVLPASIMYVPVHA